jgi:hypothetical protein
MQTQEPDDASKKLPHRSRAVHPPYVSTRFYPMQMELTVRHPTSYADIEGEAFSSN